MDERRQYVRLAATLKSTCTPVGGAQRIEVSMQNISAGGFCFVVNEPFERGTRVQGETRLEEERIPFLGEIVWSERDKMSSTFGQPQSSAIGVRMVKISPADRERIKHYVAAHL